MRFSYTTLLPNAEPRPYLNIVLRNGSHTSEIVKALVDSGADYPIFPMEIAEYYLKLDLTNARDWNFSGTTGTIQTAKLAEVSIALLEPSDMSHLFEARVTCAFCDTLKFSAGALLGQNGFFSLFKITFPQPDKHFVLEPWSAKLPLISVSAKGSVSPASSC